MSKVASLLSLAEIFENRFFTIPDYQRGYSWEEEQLLDLRKDIENLYSKNHKHFTGTIVAARVHDTENIYEIVDGQQRVTTLVILLREIYNTNKTKYQALENLFFQRGGTGNEQSVLTPNKETKEFFTDMILGTGKPEAKIKSHACIAFAQKFFRDWLGEHPDNPDKIYKVVSELFGFIFFAPPGDKEIGIMFEVINNRGKKLSELEKIKNYYIYFATVHDRKTLKDTINDKWRIIQVNLSISGQTSNESENSFLRYCYLVFYEANKEKSHAVYDQMKTRYSPQEKSPTEINQQVEQIEHFVYFLANASRYYTYFFKSGQYLSIAKGSLVSEINKTLTYLRCQPVHASIMPLYLAVMNSFDQSQAAGFSEVEKRVADLLKLIEIANFRLYVIPGVFARADSKQGIMFDLANKFFKKSSRVLDTNIEIDSAPENNGTQNDNLFDGLEAELRAIVKNTCPGRKVVEALTLDSKEEYDYYNWRDGLRFFLSCYEEHRKAEGKLSYNIERMLKLRSEVKDSLNDYLSIEHIWAQRNREDKFAATHITKRRLGNLVLMGLSANISQSDDDIDVKIGKLVHENHVGRGSLDLHQISELESHLNWALAHREVASYKRKTPSYYDALATAICDIRETKLINFALKRWGLPGEDVNFFENVDTFNARDKGLHYSYQLMNGEGQSTTGGIDSETI
jgi:hypothetical protein